MLIYKYIFVYIYILYLYFPLRERECLTAHETWISGWHSINVDVVLGLYSYCISKIVILYGGSKRSKTKNSLNDRITEWLRLERTLECQLV